MDQLCDRIRAGRSSHSLQIWKCEDAFWQRTVRRALRAADAVVMDVTELGDNMRWELSQLAAIVPAERVVLCCASKDGDLLPAEDDLLAQLSSILGPSYLARTRRITYCLPAELPRWIDRFVSPVRHYAPVSARLWPDETCAFFCAITLALEGVPPPI